MSSSQLETVVYAGHAWTQYIPGLSKPDKEGVGLVLSEDGRAYRKGYFLGDGTGAGKGRQVAAVILDNWLAGRRKNIWIDREAAERHIAATLRRRNSAENRIDRSAE